MPSISRKEYDLVNSSPTDSSSSQIDDDEQLGHTDRRRALRIAGLQSTLVVVTVLNIVLFIASATMFGSWFYHTHMQLNAKMRRGASYSPIFDRLDLGLHHTKVNGTLFAPQHDPSIARQMPNPEADAIWQEWEITRVVPVTAADIRAMGKDPSTAAKLEDEDWGLGDDAYAAIFDTYHHLHCLNLFRQIAYADYYELNDMHMKKVPGMWDIHVNHCVDIVMQALQCSGNVNLITMHWVDTQEYPYPDMSVQRSSIDFEKLTQWRAENTIDMDKYVEVMKLPRFPNAKRLRAPDEYYKYYEPNMTNPNHIDGANPGEDFNL